MDLNDWLRGERDWRDLFDLLSQLPDGSRYTAAVLSDKELAGAALDAQDPDAKPAPPQKHPNLAGYTPMIGKLDDVLNVLIALQYTLAKQDPRKAPKAPRPKTAYELLSDERQRERIQNMAHRLFGGC